MSNKCFICGADLIWDSDFDESLCGNNYITHFYSCPKCNSLYEVNEPISKECAEKDKMNIDSSSHL